MVFRHFLDCDGRLDCLSSILSVEERDRAQRFKTPQLRRRFIVTHAVLRQILAQILDRSPKSLRFDVGSHGKPFLSPRPDGLTYNMSRSSGMALFAVTRDQSIGVDVERQDPRDIDDEVMQRFFSQGEIRAIKSLPLSDRKAAFFDCWTRKEAFIKAIGRGLSFPLDQFEVSVTARSARLISIRSDTEQAASWIIRDLRPAADYSGALAVPGPCTVKRFTWTAAEA